MRSVLHQLPVEKFADLFSDRRAELSGNLNEGQANVVRKESSTH